jgi:hypothetical protein
MDANRLSLLLFTVMTLVLAAQHQGWRAWSLAGVVAGLAPNSHIQMALLVPTTIAATIGLVSNGPVRQRLLAILIPKFDAPGRGRLVTATSELRNKSACLTMARMSRFN